MKHYAKFHTPKMAALAALFLALAWATPAQTDWSAPDAAAIARFREEGSQHSQVMEVMENLTDVYGPRLTNSPEYSGSGRLRG